MFDFLFFSVSSRFSPNTWLSIIRIKKLFKKTKGAQYHSLPETCKSKPQWGIISMPVRMAAIKKSINNKCCRVCGEKGTLLHLWECKLVQPLWRTVWRFLKKLGIEQEISFLGSSLLPSGCSLNWMKVWWFKGLKNNTSNTLRDETLMPSLPQSLILSVPY